MKLCGRCTTWKVESDFHRRGSKLQSVCKACRKQMDQDYWSGNRDRLRPIKRSYRLSSLQFYQSLKDGKTCTDCGEAFPYYILQWDHPQADKTCNPVALARRGEKAILAEISKCELVCANCHAARTWERLQTGVGEHAVSV